MSTWEEGHFVFYKANCIHYDTDKIQYDLGYVYTVVQDYWQTNSQYVHVHYL